MIKMVVCVHLHSIAYMQYGQCRCKFYSCATHVLHKLHIDTNVVDCDIVEVYQMFSMRIVVAINAHVVRIMANAHTT